MLTGQVPFTGDTPLEIAMKHLSEVPEPPSELRPDVPHDLDSVVLRALAKDPSERYQSAEEMDADLARVLEGLPVDPETETAATAVLSGAGVLATAPTSVLTRPTVAAPRRAAGRRAAGRLLRLRGAASATAARSGRGCSRPAAARRAGAAAWFAYTKIQDQLDANKPVAVPHVAGIKESLAVDKIRAAGLVPQVARDFSDEVREGHRHRPEPRRRREGRSRTATSTSPSRRARRRSPCRA